jgi:8-oxo-dGTP pyrophosphatase MutT (NUDIX family)
MTTDSHTRLADFLAVPESRPDLPGVKIRDAATMLVIDRAGPTLRVLVGRRHHGHKFMPGKYVFPGGRVERADRRAFAQTALDSRVEARLIQEVRRPSVEKARGLALAAIREVFEETGLLLGTRLNSVPPNLPGQKGQMPDKALESAAAVWAKFGQAGVAPDLAAVHFIARAITPPGRSHRFDARFFAVDANAIADRIDLGRAGGVEDADSQGVQPRPPGAVLSRAARQAVADPARMNVVS